jgi:hypothetical protein
VSDRGSKPCECRGDPVEGCAKSGSINKASRRLQTSGSALRSVPLAPAGCPCGQAISLRSVALGSPRPCGLPLRAGYLPPFGSVSEWPCKGSSGKPMTDGNRLVQPTPRTRGRQIAEGDRAAAREGRAQSNPHVRWCGGSRFNPCSYPILL